MGKAIAIFNQKGGVGKTTTNINLAACLALRGKKVLVLDIDPQGNTTSGLGVAKKGLKDTVYNVLVDVDYDIRDAVIHTGVENLELIPHKITCQFSNSILPVCHIKSRLSQIRTVRMVSMNAAPP